MANRNDHLSRVQDSGRDGHRGRKDTASGLSDGRIVLREELGGKLRIGIQKTK